MTDGNSDEAARGRGSDEEAAWLDLIGRFDAPAGSPGTPAPWPDRENLASSATPSENMPGPGPGDWPGLDGPGLGGQGLGEDSPDEPGLDGSGLGGQGLGEDSPDEPGLDGSGLGGQGLSEDSPGEDSPGERGVDELRLREHGSGGHGSDGHGLRGRPGLGEGSPDDRGPRDGGQWSPAGEGGWWPPADTDETPTGQGARWPAAAGEDAAGDGPAGTGLLPGASLGPDGRFVLPGHRPLDMSPPAAPRSWSPSDEDDEEEHYTPPPPPPLPSLAPGTKAAWTGLFGGPGYLLVATLAGWSVPGWALFLAIAAFVGGFTVLVLRQSERPDEDSGPDDGAVV